MAKVFRPKISFHDSKTGAISSVTIDDTTLNSIESPGKVELKFDYNNLKDVDSDGYVKFVDRTDVLRVVGEVTNFDMFFRAPSIIYPKYNFLREINMFQASPFEAVEPGCIHFKTKWEIASDGEFKNDLEVIEVTQGDLTVLKKIFNCEKDLFVRVIYYGRTTSGSEHELVSNIRCFTSKDQTTADYEDLVRIIDSKNITFGVCSLPKLAVNLGWINNENEYNELAKTRFYNLFENPVVKTGRLTHVEQNPMNSDNKRIIGQINWSDDSGGEFSCEYVNLECSDISGQGRVVYGDLPSEVSPRFSNVEGKFYIGFLSTEINMFRENAWIYHNIPDGWFKHDWVFISKIGSLNSLDNSQFFSTQNMTSWTSWSLESSTQLDRSRVLNSEWKTSWYALKNLDKNKCSCDVNVNGKRLNPDDFKGKENIDIDVLFTGSVSRISVDIQSVYYTINVKEKTQLQNDTQRFSVTIEPKYFDGESNVGRGFCGDVVEQCILNVTLTVNGVVKMFKFLVNVGDVSVYDKNFDKMGIVVKYDDGSVKYKCVPYKYIDGNEIGFLGCPRISKVYDVVGFLCKVTKESDMFNQDVDRFYVFHTDSFSYGRKLTTQDIGIVDLIDPSDIGKVVYFKFQGNKKTIDCRNFINGKFSFDRNHNRYRLDSFTLSATSMSGNIEYGCPFSGQLEMSMFIVAREVSLWVKSIETIQSKTSAKNTYYTCNVNDVPSVNNISNGQDLGDNVSGYDYLLKTIDNFDDEISIDCSAVHYCDDCGEYHVVKSMDGMSLRHKNNDSMKPGLVEIVDGESNDTASISHYSNPVNCKPLEGSVNLTLGKDSSNDPKVNINKGMMDGNPGYSTMSTVSLRWVDRSGDLSSGHQTVYVNNGDVLVKGGKFDLTANQPLIDGVWNELVSSGNINTSNINYGGAIINGTPVRSFKWKRERVLQVSGESPYTNFPVLNCTFANIVSRSALKEFGVSSLGSFHMDFYDFFRFLTGDDSGVYWLDFKDFFTSNTFLSSDNVGVTNDINLSIQHYGEFGFNRIIGDYVETSSGFHVKMDYTETSSGPSHNIFNSDLSCGDMVMGVYTNLSSESDDSITLHQDGFVLYKSGGTINQELISKIKLKYPSFISLGSDRSFSYIAGRNILTGGQVRVEPNNEIDMGCLGAIFSRGSFRFYKFDKNKTLKKSAYHKLLSSRNNKPEQLISTITNSGTWNDYIGMKWVDIIKNKMTGIGFNNNYGNNRFMGLWSMESSDFMKLLGCSSYEILLRHLPNYQPPGNDYLGGYKFLNGGYEVKRVLITCTVGDGTSTEIRLGCYYVDMNDNILYRHLGNVGGSSGGGTLVSVSAVDKVSDAQENLYLYKNTVKSSFVWYSDYNDMSNINIDVSFLEQIKLTYPTFKWCSYDRNLDLDYMSGIDMVVLDVKFDTPKVVTAQTLRLFSDQFTPRQISDQPIASPHAPRHDSPLLRTVSDGLRRISKYVETSSYFSNFTVKKMSGFGMSGKFFAENILGIVYNSSALMSQLSEYINSESDQSYSPQQTSVTWAYDDVMYGWSPQLLMLDRSRPSQYDQNDRVGLEHLCNKEFVMYKTAPSYSPGTNDGFDYYPGYHTFHNRQSFVFGLSVSFLGDPTGGNESTFIVYSPVSCSRTNITGFVYGKPSGDDLLRLPLRNERIHYLVNNEYVKLLYQSESGSSYSDPKRYQVTWYGN